ncbi:MAG: hypothetical protein GY841_17955, partial [FCB group bacterium]|nr:hypothetical protein [FCB group bacterium]
MRGGGHPELSLVYNSNFGSGLLGLGWHLSMESISRRTRTGLSYDADNYVFSNGAGAADEIVRRGEWGPNFYGKKIENEFSKLLFNPLLRSWSVTTRGGITKSYGSTAASRQSNDFGTFAWFCDKIKDENGNIINYTYTVDGGALLPDKISYTDGKVEIRFGYTDRQDIQRSFETHSEVVTNKLLSAITVTVNSEIARQYTLEYEISPNTGRSRLSKVISPPLPPTILTWTSSDIPATQPAFTVIEKPDVPWMMDFKDFNGDSLPDIGTRQIFRHDPSPDGIEADPGTYDYLKISTWNHETMEYDPAPEAEFRIERGYLKK